MPTTLALTDPYERASELFLHGLLPQDHTLDPTDYELALFTSRPLAESPSDFSNEVTVPGYARQAVKFQANGDVVSNVDNVLFNGQDVTSGSSQDASWIGLCKKRRVSLPFSKQGAPNHQALLLPSLAVENLVHGTVTAAGTSRGYLNTNPAPSDPDIVAGEIYKLTDSSASFPTSIGFDPFGRPNTYIVITSGILRGLKLLVWGRLTATEILVGLSCDEQGWSEASQQLVGLNYTIRKLPTVSTVFGAAGAYAPELTANAGQLSTTNIMIWGKRRQGFLFKNATHDQGAKTITFDALSSNDQSTLDASLTAGDQLRILFPGSSTADGTEIVGASINSAGTVISYTGTLTNSEYAVSTPTDLYGHGPNIVRPNVSYEENTIWPNSDYWRSSETGSTDVGDAALPIVDFLASNGGFSNGLGQDFAAGFRRNLPFTGLTVRHMGSPDTTFLYQATKDLESEIMWAAEVKNLSGDPAPATYNKNNSVQFDAGQLKFYVG